MGSPLKREAFVWSDVEQTQASETGLAASQPGFTTGCPTDVLVVPLNVCVGRSVKEESLTCAQCSSYALLFHQAS